MDELRGDDLFVRLTTLHKLAPAWCSDDDKLVQVRLRALAPVRYHLDDRLILFQPDVDLTALDGLIDGDIDLINSHDGLLVRFLPNELQRG